jgi:sterol carrier protein 2
VKGVYAFKVKGGPGGQEGLWIVDAKTGAGSVEFNGKGENHRRRR